MSLTTVNAKKGGPVQMTERDVQNAKLLIAEVQKLIKDFSYLKKPQILPKAYDASLKEMKRRLIFREGLDNYVQKLKKVIELEKDRRANFVSSQVQYLPSHFWPQLKEMPATLSLDGSSKEYDFPDLKNCPEIKCDDNLFADFGTQISSNPTIDLKHLEQLQEDLDN